MEEAFMDAKEVRSALVLFVSRHIAFLPPISNTLSMLLGSRCASILLMGQRIKSSWAGFEC